MPNIVEQLESHFASNDDIIRLQKAIEGMQTTQSGHGAITVEYDKELQRRVSHKAPFLSYLENNGSVGSSNSAEVGYREKTKYQTSQFIGETAPIPEHEYSIITNKVAKMQTLVYPVEVSDMAQRGVNELDLLADEITDGFLDIAQTKDKAILQGTEAKNGFDGVFNSIKTHTVDMGGNALTKDAIDYLAQAIIDDGGNPSAIVTTAGVGRQLNNILYANGQVSIDKVELTLGNWVTGYNGPNGITIPIIVDSNITPNTANNGGDFLAFVDVDSLRIKELAPPTVIDLAKTKLSTSRVLFTYFTFYNRAEYRNGMITNIGGNTSYNAYTGDAIPYADPEDEDQPISNLDYTKTPEQMGQTTQGEGGSG